MFDEDNLQCLVKISRVAPRPIAAGRSGERNVNVIVHTWRDPGSTARRSWTELPLIPHVNSIIKQKNLR